MPGSTGVGRPSQLRSPAGKIMMRWPASYNSCTVAIASRSLTNFALGKAPRLPSSRPKTGMRNTWADAMNQIGCVTGEAIQKGSNNEV